ncbi:MAG: class I SAM-dependent methyltransferase [Myxococcota bacterium]
MEDRAQAEAYAQADFSEPNQQFVSLLEALVGGPLEGRLLDLGCGPGDIPLRLVRRHRGLQVDALDGSEAMLAIGRRDATQSPGGERVRFIHGRLPVALPHERYAHVVSNSLLHHLADPAALWESIRAAGGPGSAVLVMDLFRPTDDAAVRALVENYAADEPEVLRRDFENSLYAAYTPAEVTSQLAGAGLERLRVRTVSDRHLAVSGIL